MLSFIYKSILGFDQNMRQKVYISTIILALFYFYTSSKIYAQTQNKKISISNFTPLKPGHKNNSIEKELKNAIAKELKKYGYDPVFLGSKHSKDITNNQNNAFLSLFGQYSLSDSKNLKLYGQLYNPKMGYAIDAIYIANTIEGLESFNLPAGTHRTQKETIQLFAKRLVTRIRINPRRKEKSKRLRENVTQIPELEIQNIQMRDPSQKKESEEAFKIFQEKHVTTAARKKQKLEEAPSNVTLITSEMIRRRGYLTLTEILQDVSFIDFSTFNDSGEFPTNFMVRGQGDVGQTQVLIMENGIIQNDINFGWSRNLQYNIALIDVDRIEIIQGPSSSLYGANAYVGVINIITKKGESYFKNPDDTGFYTELQTLYGAKSIKQSNALYAPTQVAPLSQEKTIAETKSAEGVLAYKFENGATAMFTFRTFKADGDQGYGRPDPGNYFSNNYEPDSVQTITEYDDVQNDRFPDGKTPRLKDGFDTSKDNLFLRGRFEIGNYFTGFTYWKKSDGLGSYVPGYEYFANTPGKRYQVDHQGQTVYAGHKVQATRKLFTMNRLYYRGNKIRPDTGFIYTYRFQDVINPIADDGTQLPPQPDLCKCYFAEGNLIGVESQWNYKIMPTNEIVGGVQIEHAQSQDFSISFGKPQDPGSNETPLTFSNNAPFLGTSRAKVFYNTTAGFFLEDEQKFLQDYAATVGFRYDEFNNVVGADRIRYQDRTIADGVFTPRAALTGNPWHPVFFKLLYGESFKSPTNFQLFDEFRGNQNLKPQQNRTYESILIYKFRKLGRIKLNYFFSELQEVIKEKPNDGSRAIGDAGQFENFFQNVEATHIYGASILVELNVTQSSFVYAGYNYTADRDPKTPLNVIVDKQTNQITKIELLEDGKEIDNIAMRKANIGFNYLFNKKLNINTRLNWVGRRKAPKSNKYFQPYDFEFIRKNYPYKIEGTPDGYMSGYTLVNLSLIWKNWFGIKNLDPQIIVRNLFDKKYAGIGRQSGAGVRPIDSLQTSIQNPQGFIPPYHPQPRREIYFRLDYKF